MPGFDDDITAYYDRGEEAGRLGDWGRLEMVRTQVLLERYLPPTPAQVLDVGGGPGVYAAWLAALGYRVRLIDPVELHVEQARAAGVERAEVGDARALDAEDGSADAVLLLGPLYHLPEGDDRRRALAEAWRVLRPGGVVAAAAIARFASAIDGLVKGFVRDPEFERIVESDLREGRHSNPSRNPRWFTTAYFHLPDDLAAEVHAAGFQLTTLAAVEGIGAWLPDVDDWLDDVERRAVLLRTIARVETEPSLLGASPHLLAVGVKP
ncbi:MAG TPA: class I SAM-dependent methyltransferase [Solirubrobacteraceae bacterium]|nr:class I SAM-dependent methyltransferase [Solirubrobacteraceae bacterium]